MALKTRARIGSAVDKDILERLRKMSEETRIPIARLLDEAIGDLLSKYDKKNGKR